MEVALPDPIDRLWFTYLAAESRGAREVKLRALDEFIEELFRLPDADWKRWALKLAERVVDDCEPIPVRQPLFDRVLLPALDDALTQRMAGSARWLAGFVNHLQRFSGNQERGSLKNVSEQALLRIALEHDPCDSRARCKLIERVAQYFQYTLHELPWGVLYGADGATVSQCDELAKHLEEFASLSALEGQGEDFRPLVMKCQFHFDAYKRYLLTRSSHSSYAEFLESQNERCS